MAPVHEIQETRLVRERELRHTQIQSLAHTQGIQKYMRCKKVDEKKSVRLEEGTVQRRTLTCTQLLYAN